MKYSAQLHIFHIYLVLATKTILIHLAACGAFSLIACANGEPETNTSTSAGTISTTTNEGRYPQHQGHTSIHTDIAHAQIIMSDLYHLELIAEPKKHGIILNFHLENNANHKASLIDFFLLLKVLQGIFR